jgi:hypothetical protein
MAFAPPRPGAIGGGLPRLPIKAAPGKPASMTKAPWTRRRDPIAEPCGVPLVSGRSGATGSERLSLPTSGGRGTPILDALCYSDGLLRRTALWGLRIGALQAGSPRSWPPGPPWARRGFAPCGRGLRRFRVRHRDETLCVLRLHRREGVRWHVAPTKGATWEV